MIFCALLCVLVSNSRSGRVYSIVSPDSEYTPVAFNFNAPFGIIFDEYAYERGAPRLFVSDFHRLIQIDLDPESFPMIVRDIDRTAAPVFFVANISHSCLCVVLPISVDLGLARRHLCRHADARESFRSVF